MGCLALSAVLAAGLVVAVLALREATMAAHQPVAEGSALTVVVRVSTHMGEPGQSLAEMAESLLVVCRLEVTADRAGRPEDLGRGRFRVVLRPSLDRSNRLQFRGCLEDRKVDHVRIDVESMHDQ